MLDKLGRNKILLIFLLAFSACRSEYEKPGVYHTELICPNHDVILIRYSRLPEVRKAIINSYNHKKKYSGSETYTVISLASNRSMRINKLLPEDAINCSLREIYYSGYDKFKKSYTKTPGYNIFD